MKKFLRSFSSLPLIYSRRVVVSYRRKYVHKLLVNGLFKPAQEKVWLSELAMTIAVDMGRKETKTNKQKHSKKVPLKYVFFNPLYSD